MIIDKLKFFEAYRKYFKLTHLKSATVQTLDAIIDEFNSHPEVDADLQKKAYMLATVRAECGDDMTPITENMNYSAERIKQVWPSRPEAVKYAHNPEALGNSVYANRLGNGPPSSGDGYRYRGRGIGAQFTGRDQYLLWGKIMGVDLLNHPELALDVKFGAAVLYKGSVEGLFTGVGLGKYITSTKVDYINARRVVNNDVGRMGARIAYDATLFESVLNDSCVAGSATQPEPEITPQVQTSSGWEGLWNALKEIFK